MRQFEISTHCSTLVGPCLPLYILAFGEGTTEKVHMILSGYSSRILDMSNVPMPDPEPPPKD